MHHFRIPLGVSPVLIGFSTADDHIISEHFLQFSYTASGLRARRSFLQLIWLACVWVIWMKEILDCSDPQQIQCTSYWTKSKRFLIGG
jgi:hypothetical protein